MPWSSTPSEFTLVSLLMTGHDLASAAAFTGASYDTKRKQVRLTLEKAGVSGQPALLREVSIALSSYVLDDLLRPEQQNPEVDLVRAVYGRDVVVHTISFYGIKTSRFGSLAQAAGSRSCISTQCWRRSYSPPTWQRRSPEPPPELPHAARPSRLMPASAKSRFFALF